MKNTRNYLAISGLLLLSACGSRQFTQGEYDDPNVVRHLDDEFNESDAQVLSQEMIVSLQQHPTITAAKTPPVVQMEVVRNKTSEHIDTKMITDAVRTAILKTGKLRFSNKEDRNLREGEVDYALDSGRYKKDTQKRRDGGIAPDYLITGDLISNVQQVGSKKLVFYKLTLNMTDLESGLIVWSEEKPIRKRFKKKSVGL
ncbi:MAG: penicillin-binding protein activator LpoB [Bdellovibrionota bacterium]